MTLTRTLSEIGLETDTDCIRPEAYAAAKKMVLDTLGCALMRWPTRREETYWRLDCG